MSENILEEVKKGSDLSIVLENVRVDDLLNDSFLDLLKKAYPKTRIRPSILEVTLLPELEEEPEEEAEESEEEGIALESEKGINIQIASNPPQIRFKHRGEKDYDDRRIVLEADQENHIEAILEELGGE